MSSESNSAAKANPYVVPSSTTPAPAGDDSNSFNWLFGILLPCLAYFAAAVWMQYFWLERLRQAYEEFGIALPKMTQLVFWLHKIPVGIPALVLGLALAGCFLVFSVRQFSRNRWLFAALLLLLHGIMLSVLAILSFAAYSPVFSIRSAGVDIWI